MNIFTENPNDPAIVDPWDIRAWYTGAALFLVIAAVGVYNSQTAIETVASVAGALPAGLFLSVGMWKIGGALRN